MEDSGILELYFLRNEQAIQETERKIRRVLQDHCGPDSQEPGGHRGNSQRYLAFGLECHPAPKAELFAGLPGPDHPEWGH